MQKTHHMHESDEAIVAAIQAGDSDRFGEIIDRYEAKLGRYARRFLLFGDELTDLVQDVFIKAYVNIQSFDTKRRFSPWLYRIAHNEFINALKKREKQAIPFFHLDTWFPQLTAPETADQNSIKQEDALLVEQSLNILPAIYREPLVLFFYENMSYEEIGQILSLPTTTVGVRIARAKAKLKQALSASNQQNL